MNTIFISNTKMKVNMNISMCIHTTMNTIINMNTTVNVNMNSEMKTKMTMSGNKRLIQLKITHGMSKCVNVQILV